MFANGLKKKKKSESAADWLSCAFCFHYLNPGKHYRIPVPKFTYIYSLRILGLLSLQEVCGWFLLCIWKWLWNLAGTCQQFEVFLEAANHWGGKFLSHNLILDHILDGFLSYSRRNSRMSMTNCTSYAYTFFSQKDEQQLLQLRVYYNISVI